MNTLNSIATTAVLHEGLLPQPTREAFFDALLAQQFKYPELKRITHTRKGTLRARFIRNPDWFKRQWIGNLKRYMFKHRERLGYYISRSPSSFDGDRHILIDLLNPDFNRVDQEMIRAERSQTLKAEMSAACYRLAQWESLLKSDSTSPAVRPYIERVGLLLKHTVETIDVIQKLEAA